MSEPMMFDPRQALASMAERVTDRQPPVMEPYLANTINRVIEKLREEIPGLETLSDHDVETTELCRREADEALDQDQTYKALEMALSGLSVSPHDPYLWFIVSTCCLDLWAPGTALVVTKHVLWINPSLPEANRRRSRLEIINREAWDQDRRE